jgi:predicted Rossmann fold nucleotide-binding protein DprA/Smf involved in DNA uptake
VLFVAGDVGLLEAGGVAIVGSRDVDPVAVEFARAVAAATARDGLPVVSGGARGVDQQAMQAAFEAGGRVIGILPEGIERRTREASTRVALADGQAVIASPYHPGAGFTAGAAMGRNKLVYALSDVAVVVASAAETGGTWTGAVEAIAGRWVPLFVRQADDMPDGNRRLIDRGGIPLNTACVPEVPAGWGAVAAAPRARPRSKKQRAAEAKAPYEQASLDLVEP